MKYNKIVQFVIILAFVCGISACSEEYEYKKFLEGGEIYYPGKIVNTRVLSGRGRVALSGLFISDPKVTQCLVYWNVRQDSVIYPVVRDDLFDTLYEVLEVKEGIHNFEFITMDDKGNRSVVVNATGQSYGDKYQNQLRNRPIRDTLYSKSDSTLTIVWAGMDLTTGVYKTEVQYNLGTSPQEKHTSINVDTTYISDYDGSGYKYRTFFQPDPTCIDVFWTEFETIE